MDPLTKEKDVATVVVIIIIAFVDATPRDRKASASNVHSARCRRQGHHQGVSKVPMVRGRANNAVVTIVLVVVVQWSEL